MTISGRKIALAVAAVLLLGATCARAGSAEPVANPPPGPAQPAVAAPGAASAVPSAAPAPPAPQID